MRFLLLSRFRGTGDKSEQSHEIPSQDPAICVQSVPSSIHPSDIIKSAFTIAQWFQWARVPAMSGENVQATNPIATAYENARTQFSIWMRQMWWEIPSIGPFQSAHGPAWRVQISVHNVREQFQSGFVAEEAHATAHRRTLPSVLGVLERIHIEESIEQAHTIGAREQRGGTFAKQEAYVDGGRQT